MSGVLSPELLKPVHNFTSAALKFSVIKECPVSKARASLLKLPHYTVETPVFMPVGTKGALKGLLPEQLEEVDCQIMLGNTYHLGSRPGPQLLENIGGLHKFMGWNRALLTDSGGFQMVSLLDLAEITEEGVKFISPQDKQEMMLTPEKSIEIQNSIGADIIMQLDDVVSSVTTGPRVQEAMERTIRWLDRGLKSHKKRETQNLFPIVQGGLNLDLRKICAEELLKRDVPGYAIGGLSGGEEKQDFWKMVNLCTDILPKDKPRYLMGVGYAVDLVVCCALGVDMFDCVFPTRTARFGGALTLTGQLILRKNIYEEDFGPIDDHCSCLTCKTYSRAYLHSIIERETVACQLLTIHNMTFQMNLMHSIRKNIMQGTFTSFVQDFMKNCYPQENYPSWVVQALASVKIHLSSD